MFASKIRIRLFLHNISLGELLYQRIHGFFKERLLGGSIPVNVYLPNDREFLFIPVKVVQTQFCRFYDLAAYHGQYFIYHILAVGCHDQVDLACLRCRPEQIHKFELLIWLQMSLRFFYYQSAPVPYAVEAQKYGQC